MQAIHVYMHACIYIYIYIYIFAIFRHVQVMSCMFVCAICKMSLQENCRQPDESPLVTPRASSVAAAEAARDELLTDVRSCVS